VFSDHISVSERALVYLVRIEDPKVSLSSTVRIYAPIVFIYICFSGTESSIELSSFSVIIDRSVIDSWNCFMQRMVDFDSRLSGVCLALQVKTRHTVPTLIFESRGACHYSIFYVSFSQPYRYDHTVAACPLSTYSLLISQHQQQIN
jgi:hypothetical protein